MTDVNEEVFGNGNPEGTPPTPAQVVAQPIEGEKVDPVVELIASPDDPPVTPGETPPVEPTVDAQKATTEEYYQTKYQDLMATLDKDAPAPILGQPDVASPATPATVAQPQEPVEDDIYLAQINKRFDQFEQRHVAQQQATVDAQFAHEEQQAGAALKQYASEAGITQEQLNEAYNTAQDMGIPYRRIGGPTAYVKFIAKHVDHQRLRNGPTPQEVTTLAAAEQKALTDKMVVQPNMATPGAPVAQSREEKILSIMQAAGSSDAAKEVYG